MVLQPSVDIDEISTNAFVCKPTFITDNIIIIIIIGYLVWHDGHLYKKKYNMATRN